jgi:hypothetical protein
LRAREGAAEAAERIRGGLARDRMWRFGDAGVMFGALGTY